MPSTVKDVFNGGRSGAFIGVGPFAGFYLLPQIKVPIMGRSSRQGSASFDDETIVEPSRGCDLSHITAAPSLRYGRPSAIIKLHVGGFRPSLLFRNS